MSIQIVPSNRRLGHFLASESGVTAIEYALIAGGIALAIIVAVNSTGQALKPGYEAVDAGLEN